MSYLSEYFGDKERDIEPISNKVLCIFEGNAELAFVKKTYDLVKNIAIEFDCFLDDVIHLSWGKMPVVWNNKQQGDFQGGRIGETPVPYPVLESLHNSNIELYAATLIMFDADLDVGDDVLNKAQLFTQEHNCLIFRSEPCLEAEALDLVKNDETATYVAANHEEIGSSKCRWYKKSWGRIPKQEKFKNIQSVKSLIPCLELIDFADISHKLSKFKCFIEQEFSQ